MTSCSRRVVALDALQSFDVAFRERAGRREKDERHRTLLQALLETDGRTFGVVEREWRYIRAWLHGQLDGRAPR